MLNSKRVKKRFNFKFVLLTLLVFIGGLLLVTHSKNRQTRKALESEYTNSYHTYWTEQTKLLEINKGNSPVANFAISEKPLSIYLNKNTNSVAVVTSPSGKTTGSHNLWVYDDNSSNSGSKLQLAYQGRDGVVNQLGVPDHLYYYWQDRSEYEQYRKEDILFSPDGKFLLFTISHRYNEPKVYSVDDKKVSDIDVPIYSSTFWSSTSKCILNINSAGQYGPALQDCSYNTQKKVFDCRELLDNQDELKQDILDLENEDKIIKSVAWDTGEKREDGGSHCSGNVSGLLDNDTEYRFSLNSLRITPSSTLSGSIYTNKNDYQENIYYLLDENEE